MARGRSTIVGAFVLGAIAIGVLAVVLFGGERLFTRKLRVVAYFQNSVAGLVIGAPVTLRGVKVGTVRGMKVYLKLPELVPVIPVYMEIEPSQVSWTNDPAGVTGAADLQLAVNAGLRAQLETQSLVTGQVTVNLDFHPDSNARLLGSDGTPEIPTIPSDIQQLKDEISELKLPELMEKARAALAGINDIVGELDGKVGPMADSLKQTLDGARALVGTASDAVKQVQADASRTLDSVSHLAKSAEGTVQLAGKDIDKVAGSVDHVAARAEKVMDNLNDMTAPRSPIRDNLESMARDLSASASSLRDLSRNLERNPTGTLLGRASK